MGTQGNWDRRISRRRFIGLGGMGAAALVIGGQGSVLAGERPGDSRTGGTRPRITHGIQSGDVTTTGAIVWARADRPSRMFVEAAATEAFRKPRIYKGPLVDESTDFTAQLDLSGLPSGQDVFYRVRFEDARTGRSGEPVFGTFRTPSTVAGRGVSFVWSGDTAGQGWGINPDFGGMRIYETMRGMAPDFFIHSGDTVYADGPIQSSVTLPDGTLWRNVVTEEKNKVAETLGEFRGNYKYNLLDENVKSFNAEVPMLAQWDDHETTNNWYPGEILDDPRYTETSVDVLAARANRAFHEYMPVRQGARDEEGRIYRKVGYGPLLDVFFLDMRTYRGPNTANDQPIQSAETAILGARQLEWLEQGLAASTATWKAIASDMPIGLIVSDGPAAFEAIANAKNDAALGRELEIADLLSFIKVQGIENTVWFTADVHYTAAHYYDPNLAAFQDFDPFWEFVSGPLNAGTFGPNTLDGTFGPQVRFQKAAERPNQPPSDGLQFFGHTTIAGDTGVMTVRLKDLAGSTLYSVDLVPGR